jgi:hypothetical protein
LLTADADRTRIELVRTDGERLFTLPDDTVLLEQKITELGARLVVVDPLVAFLSGAVDAHRDHSVRRALAPLAALAERTGAAIVVVRHLPKTQKAEAVLAGGGSIGFIGLARSALIVDADPDDKSRRILAVVKNNVAAPAPSLAFRIMVTDGQPLIAWDGEAALSAADLAAARVVAQGGEGDRSKLDQATELVVEWLTGGPMPQREIEKLARANGISDSTLDRAKRRCGVEHERVGFGPSAHYVWRLPSTMRVNGPICDADDAHAGAPVAYPVDAATVTHVRQARGGELDAHGVVHMEQAPAVAPIDGDLLPEEPGF